MKRALVLLLVAGCVSGNQRAGRRAPAWYANEAKIALRNGEIERAVDSIDRGLGRHPRSDVLRSWKALLAQMQWQDVRALVYLGQLRDQGEYGGIERAELMGRIGDVLFRSGAYSDSIPFLEAGEVGRNAERRQALASLARELPYSRVDPPEFIAELPLLEGALPRLLCTIGDRQRPFVLDTGASMTALAESLAIELGVEHVIPAGTGLDGAGNPLDVSFGLMDSLSLGSVDLSAQPVLVVSDDRLALRDPFGGPEQPPRGVVGLDILARFRVTFDPERRSVLFQLSQSLDGPRVVQCVHHDGFCLVPVTVEGRRLWFALDTGASHSSLTEVGLASLPGARQRARVSFRRVRGPGGGFVSVREVPGLSLEVSAVRFDSVVLPVVERNQSTLFPVHGVLGSDLVMRCRTTFDDGRLLFEAL